eukprot:gene10976-3048_t
MTNNFSQYALLVALVIVATIPKCNSSNWSPIYRVPGTCECTDNPECGCENNAECTNIENNEHICECTQGFSGPRCGHSYDPCDPDPCGPGNCTFDASELKGLFEEERNYTCSCPLDVVGMDCELECPKNCITCNAINSIAVCSQCSAGYFLTISPNECVEECPPGFLPNDDICEEICEAITCQNGGTCKTIAETVSDACTCMDGFQGDLCEIITACINFDCFNGTCSLDGNLPKCDCFPGFEGERCEDNIDECSPNPCNNQTCIDETAKSKLTVILIHVNMEAPAQVFRMDSFAIGSITASVQHLDISSRTGNECEEFVDLCAPEHLPCNSNGNCTQFGDSRQCLCSPGFSGDYCEESICVPSPCQHGDCIVTLAGEWSCRCPPDKSGSLCQFQNACFQADICGENPCIPEQESYVCSCSDGSQVQQCPMLTSPTPTTNNTDPFQTTSTALLSQPVQIGIIAAGGILAAALLLGFVRYCQNNRPIKRTHRKSVAPSRIHSFSNPSFDPGTDMDQYLSLQADPNDYVTLAQFQQVSPSKRQSLPLTTWKSPEKLRGITEDHRDNDSVGLLDSEYLAVGKSERATGSSQNPNTASTATNISRSCPDQTSERKGPLHKDSCKEPAIPLRNNAHSLLSLSNPNDVSSPNTKQKGDYFDVSKQNDTDAYIDVRHEGNAGTYMDV